MKKRILLMLSIVSISTAYAAGGNPPPPPTGPPPPGLPIDNGILILLFFALTLGFIYLKKSSKIKGSN